MDTVGTAAGKTGFACSWCKYYELHNNTVSNSGNGQGCLYGYGVDWADVRGNYVTGCGVLAGAPNVGSGVHFDSFGGGNISQNVFVDDGSHDGGISIFSEVSSYTAIEENTITLTPNSTNGFNNTQGIFSGTNNFTIAGGRTQQNSFDTTTGLTAATNVTLTTDGADKQERTASVVATTNSSFTTGTLFFANITAVNPWKSFFDIWIKPATTVAADSLQWVNSLNTALSTSDIVVHFPRLVGGVWTRLIMYQYGWAASSHSGSSGGIQSYGLQCNVSCPSTSFKVDDFDYAYEMIGNKIANNTVVNANNQSYFIGAWQGGIVSGNYASGANDNLLNRMDFAFLNSQNVVFNGNRGIHGIGPTSTTFINANASSVIDAGGNTTDATTRNTLVAGGSVIADPQTNRTASCTTAAAAGSTCTTTVTWALPYLDTSYTAACTIDNPTAVPYVLNTSSKAAGSIVVSIANLTAVAASGTLNCTAKHD